MNKEDKFYIEFIPIEKIIVEKRFDRAGGENLNIDILANDIKENGMHTEIWLNQISDDEFVCIAGYRRLMASQMLEKTLISSKVFKVTEMEAKYMACSENSNRINYNYFEKVENFLFLFHCEYMEKGNKNASAPYIPISYVSVVSFVLNKMITKGDKISLFTKQDEKLVYLIIKSVFTKSGLYESYIALYKSLPLVNSSLEIKRFAIVHQINVFALREIMTFEKRNTGVIINDSGSSAIEVLLKKISALKSKGRDEIKIVIANMNIQIAGDNSSKMMDNWEKIYEDSMVNSNSISTALSNKKVPEKDKRHLLRALKKYNTSVENLLNKINKDK